MTRTTPRRSGARRWIGATAVALTALTVPAAHAESGVTVLGPDGRVLSVGSVVATGERTGDVCSFGASAVTVVGDAASGTVTLRADDSCNLVVGDIGVTPGANADPASTALRRPKVQDTSSASASGAGLVNADTVAQVQADYETFEVQVQQDVYSEANLRQYQDYMAAEYREDRKTHALSGPTLLTGWCTGSYLDDVLESPYGVDVRGCFFKPDRTGPYEVSFVSGGLYRTTYAGIEFDRRQLTESFSVKSNGAVVKGCDVGGWLPLGWSSVCTWIHQ